MKHSFDFIKIANWIYRIHTILKNFRRKLDEENVSNEQAIQLLQHQKRQLELIKDVINRKTYLVGIQPEFIKNLKQIKKEYGIED